MTSYEDVAKIQKKLAKMAEKKEVSVHAMFIAGSVEITFMHHCLNWPAWSRLMLIRIFYCFVLKIECLSSIVGHDSGQAVTSDTPIS